MIFIILRGAGCEPWYPISREKRGRYPDFLHAAPCDNHACGFRKSGVRGTRSLVAGKVRRAFFFTLDVASHLLAMPNFL
jgi:hypothetical protein